MPSIKNTKNKKIDDKKIIENTENIENVENIENKEDATKIEELPKKRGRKPKRKNDNDDKTDDKTDNKSDDKGEKDNNSDSEEDSEKTVKKRGRKPKIKSGDDEVKEPRKRGRKPKEKSYSVSKPIISKVENNEEHVILHLPITMEEFKKEGLYKDNGKKNGKKSKDKNKPDEKSTNDLIETKGEETELKEDEKTLLTFLKNKEIIQINDNIEKKIVKRNVLNIMYEFIDANEKNEWPNITNIYCQWCCHPFNTPPCALPIKYIKGKFFLRGCFCSFNCAAAYNFDNKDYDMWERYSLLNFLYKKMYQTPYIRVKIAPPRESLKIFGGFLSIEEFRLNFLVIKQYEVILPPMISIIPKIEENIFENSMKSSIGGEDKLKENKEAGSGIAVGTGTGTSLRLKREKPITNPKMTLESYMGLKIL